MIINIKRVLINNKSNHSLFKYRTFRNCFQFCEKSKNSNWIYSSKYDELLDSKKGKIYICTQTGNDCHDVTMRMYKAFFQSNIIFSYDNKQTERLIAALAYKDRFIYPEIHKNSQQTQLTLSKIATQLTQVSLQKQQVKSFNRDIQMSKHLDMAIDLQSIAKKKNDPGNKILFGHQQKLRQYLRMKQFRAEIEEQRQKRGFPKVLPLLQEESQIVYLHQNGFNVTYILHQYLIQNSSKLLNTLEKLKIPYQVLPSKSELINTIVTSGLPADRFSIQYFPQNLQEILRRRKNMKMTIAMVIKKDNLYNTIQTIMIQYGKQHKIYVQNALSFSDEVHLFVEYQKENSFQHLENIKLVISPYITQFNEVLKQEVNQIRHIYGQAISEKTNFVDLEILEDKLMKLKKKESTFQVDIFNMAAEMLQKLGNQQIVKKSLKTMLGLQQSQLQQVILQAKKRVKVDYLGIKQMIEHGNRHKKQKKYSTLRSHQQI